jgi:hypothetical protein
LVIDAVKVILVPLQTAPLGLALTVMVGTSMGFTVMVTWALAVVAVTHVTLLVMVQETTCPLASVELLYVAVLVPTGLPSTNHW